MILPNEFDVKVKIGTGHTHEGWIGIVIIGDEEPLEVRRKNGDCFRTKRQASREARYVARKAVAVMSELMAGLNYATEIVPPPPGVKTDD